MPLKLMYITNKEEVALTAQKYGVDRIWIDLETKGKEERQKGRDTVKNRHTVEDIRKIRPLLSASDLLVRINPWDGESRKEVEEVVSAGADIIMLPMWRTPEEVRAFVGAVDGRCRTLLLLETRGAERCLDEVLSVPGVDEIHIGMNDLHLEYGLTYLFELLTNGKIEELCGRIREAGIPYGFGGVGIIGAGLVPRPEQVILEHYRLGSTGVILSRSFCNCEKAGDPAEVDRIFRRGIRAMREKEKEAESASEERFSQNRKAMAQEVAGVVRRMKGNDGKET